MAVDSKNTFFVNEYCAIQKRDFLKNLNINVSAESNRFGYSRRCFTLLINYLIQHDFFCVVFRVVHFLHPQERVGGFEFFGDTAIFHQAGEGEFDLPLCLLFGIVEMLIECAPREKRTGSQARCDVFLR